MAGFFDVIRQPPVEWGSGEEYPLFNRINIETTSFCNRKCGFCPIAKGTREEKVYMDQGLFEKVVTELEELQFDGVVQLFFLNEPFLDRRILDFARCAGTACPRASIYMSTNGDPLGKDLDRAEAKLLEAFNSGLTVINLNVYDSGEAGAERRAFFDALLERGIARGNWEHTGHKYRHHPPKRSFVAITDMRPERLSSSVTDMFHDRIAENKSAEDPGIPRHCMRTQRHMIVEHDGRVPICCAIDPTIQSERVPRVGNVRDRTIASIWNDETFFKYRYFTQQARREMRACRGCNHKMAYPHVVRRVSADPATTSRWEAEARDGLGTGAANPRAVGLPVLGSTA